MEVMFAVLPALKLQTGPQTKDKQVIHHPRNPLSLISNSGLGSKASWSRGLALQLSRVQSEVFTEMLRVQGQLLGILLSAEDPRILTIGQAEVRTGAGAGEG